MSDGLSYDFHNDVVYVVGNIVCARSWAATKQGILTGVTHRQPWTSGENRAVCAYSGVDSHPSVPEGWDMESMPGYGNHRYDKHVPGSLGCACGFWAYFNPNDGGTWVHSGVVRPGAGLTGIVHAFGRMTRGKKGCRSEKARIVALITPKWADLPKPTYAAYSDATRVRQLLENWASDRRRGAGMWQLIQANYPDIPVYETAEEAYHAHPLTTAA